MLKLDGYKQTDEAKAYETGIERVYNFPAPYGPKGGRAKLTAVFKYGGAGNVEYEDARAHLVATMPEGEDRSIALTAALYDHCIVEWSTDLQSEGKSLKGTRENFLGLATLDVPEIATGLGRLIADIHDRQRFVKEQLDETVKN